MNIRCWATLLVVALAGPAGAETLAEKLGHPPGSKLLILHGDDLGMCRAANAAAEKAFAQGVMSSGSAMVPCPWFPELAAWAKGKTDHDLGLHLTLTSEWRHYRWGPVAPREKVPGLLDPQGFLWRSVPEVLAHARFAEVESEIRAQVQRARALGLEPTHLDSHMGTLFASPFFFMVYLKVAREEQVVPMIPRPTAGKVARDLKAKGLTEMAALFVATAERQGYPVIERLESTQGKTYEQRKEHLLGIVRSLSPGVTEVILHPSEMTDELAHVTNSARARADDLRLLLDPELKKAIEEAGVKLLQWRTINEWWKRQREAKEERR